MTPNEKHGVFQLDDALRALEGTPRTLSSLLANLPDTWLDFKEDHEAWSPRRVLVHFIHNEQNNWLPRARIILSDSDDRVFAPFQQMPEDSQLPPGGTDELLGQFAGLRERNLATVRQLGLTPADLDREGVHPVLGTINLRQLISTWVVHDLNHLHQIAKSLAKHYRAEVGPWRRNLAILDL